MIRLTRLNNRPLVVNSDLIKFIENAPDTVITLVSGEKIVVLETADEVIVRIVGFRRRLQMALPSVVPHEDPADQPVGHVEPDLQEKPDGSSAEE
jgi:flagellar protein FlbD